MGCQNEPVTVKPEDKTNEIDIEVQSDEMEKESESNKVEEGEEHSELTLETLKGQKAGILVQDIPSQFEIEAINNKSLEEQQMSEVVGELRKIIENAEDPNEIYDGIVYLLGAPNYQKLIEEAEDFEPQFDMTYLPETEEGLDIRSERGKSIILLDANATMLEPIDGQKKLDIVKDSILPFLEVLDQNTDISIVAYGHQSNLSESKNSASCENIEEIYPMETLENYEQALTSFEAFGKSPLAGAIQKATEISGDREEISLYIVSKEAETCGKDPLKEIETFREGFPDRAVHVIGFQVEDDSDDLLKQLAYSGKGTYYAANNEEEIRAIIDDHWRMNFIDLVITQTQAPGPWEVLDEYNRFDVELNQIRDAIKAEKERYDQAVQIIRIESLMNSDLINQVSNIINKEYRMKLEVIGDFRSEKLAEIDHTAENIRYSIDKWKSELKQ